MTDTAKRLFADIRELAPGITTRAADNRSRRRMHDLVESHSWTLALNFGNILLRCPHDFATKKSHVVQELRFWI
jgi:hypothetical protein